jgi:hypothetical protein
MCCAVPCPRLLPRRVEARPAEVPADEARACEAGEACSQEQQQQQEQQEQQQQEQEQEGGGKVRVR